MAAKLPIVEQMNTVCEPQIGRLAVVEDAEQTLPPAPLVVDINRTIIKTDLQTESLLALLKREPHCLFLLPLWAARGKFWFEREVSRRSSLEIATLPWRTEFIDFLKQQRGQGRCLVLATAGDPRSADQVADHLKLFDVVLSGERATSFSGEVSERATSFSGEVRRKALAARFGDHAFDYAAEGRDGDLVVWRSARRAVLTNPSSHVRKAAAKEARIEGVFPKPVTSLALWLEALRPVHWLKNLLVLVPLLAAHRVLDARTLGKAFLAFTAFGCCASGGYLFNDLLDLDADRHHPQKRLRPLASGGIQPLHALIAIPLLVLAGCLLSTLVSPLFLAILLGYFAMSAAYSLCIKRIAILDVLFLAGLYTVRLMAGSAATSDWPSHWLLAFSMFLFFSLALVKRYSELVMMRQVAGAGAKARGYEVGDRELLAAMGTASGYLAVLVLALYIGPGEAQALYSHHQLLWALCPLLLYWVSYFWLTAHRGQDAWRSGDICNRDRTSRILILLMAATAIVAIVVMLRFSISVLALATAGVLDAPKTIVELQPYPSVKLDQNRVPIGNTGRCHTGQPESRHQRLVSVKCSLEQRRSGIVLASGKSKAARYADIS